MKKSIIWFKTDLRLHDNETLSQAVLQSDEVLPVYCFNEAHFTTTNYGFQKNGNFRTQFILESLYDLDGKLRTLGSGLLIVKGNAAEELFKLAKQYGAQTIFAKEEVAWEEIQNDKAVANKVSEIGCTLKTYNTSTLYNISDLPFDVKNIPDVFTEFRKKVEKQVLIKPVIAPPKSIASPEIQPIKLPTMVDLGLTPPVADMRSVLDFKGGETEGLKRLHYYFFGSNAVLTYKQTRNGMIGPDYSTKFSAWMAQGCLSPRAIYDELKKYEGLHGSNDSTYWLVFELLWRDYFRLMMMKYEYKLFRQQGIKTSLQELAIHDAFALKRWINGSTGIDFIDANMHELQCTGFMSNRGRQNVASYLVNDMKLDWRYGAAYFEQQLIDYDPSSNWGNWAYVAGVGNDPRGNRYFNIEKQATDYDLLGLYRKLWLNNGL